MSVAPRLLGLLTALLVLTAPVRAQWINEVHYDNTGGDAGEAVEVILPESADPAAFDLYLYNGNGGAVYTGPLNLAGSFTEGDTENGFTVYSRAVVVQNGDPDGLALAENGVLVPGQFLSYEGTFTAVGGPADGATSTDIGVTEDGDTPVGASLQLGGTGSAYEDFSWQTSADDSFGSVNDGQTLSMPLLAQLQIIHNAPDPAFAEVDVYVNGDLLEDDLAFRSATPFLGVAADTELEVAVAPGTSSSAADAIFTQTYALDDELSYQLVATGVGDGDFEANPDGNDIAFTLLVNPDARLFSPTPDSTPDFNFVHGTPDAPAIDVRTGATQDIIIYNDVAFGELAPYQPIAAEPQTIEVTTADGTASVAMFELDLSGRPEAAGTILASGFLTPDNEDDANGTPPAFGLLVVFADGSETFAEPLSVSNEGGAALPTAFALRGSYPNPSATRTTIAFDLPADASVGLDLFDVLGRRVLSRAPEPVAAGADRRLAVEAALPSGVYVFRLTAETAGGRLVESGRMTVVR